MRLKQFQNKGFTLIELLIVVALLGILAVGLLAAIDPIEQIQKGRDTTVEALAKDYLGAQQRYYANTGAFANLAASQTGVVLPAASYNAASLLVTTGELKATWGASNNTASIARIMHTTDANLTTLTVCFHPLSKGLHSSAPAIYGPSGAVLAGCPSTAPNTAPLCYICMN